MTAHGMGCRSDHCSGREHCALDGFPDVIARYDIESRCICVNSSYERVSGVPSIQEIGRTPLEASGLSKEVANALHALLQSVIETRQEEGCEIAWGEERDGEPRVFYLLAIPELDVSGELRSIFTVMSDISTEKMAERQSRETYARLRLLAERRASDWEEERRQLAWNLQEDMGQIMAAIKVSIGAVLMGFEGGDGGSKERIQEVDHLVDRCLGMSKEMADTLRPAVLNLGIDSSLEWLCDNFSRKSGIACKLRIEPYSDLGEELVTLFFRIVQAALDHVAHDAEADMVEVSLQESDGEYVLGVMDNGEGDASGKAKMSGFGLMDLQERIAMRGGRMVIFSAPGQGTVVEARLPIVHGAPSA